MIDRKTFLKQISPQKAMYMMYYHTLKTNGRKGYSQNYQDKVINALDYLHNSGGFNNKVETSLYANFTNASRTLDQWGIITRDGTGYHELTNDSYILFEEKVGHDYLNLFLAYIESTNTIAELEQKVEIRNLQIEKLKQQLQEINKLSAA